MLTSNVASRRVSKFDVYLYYRSADEKYQRCFSHRINVRQFDTKFKIIFICGTNGVRVARVRTYVYVQRPRRLGPETKARDLGCPRALWPMLGIQSEICNSTLYTIDNRARSQIETRWQMPELQRTQTPGCGPTQRFQAKSACLYQFFSAEYCTVITFQVFQ